MNISRTSNRVPVQTAYTKSSNAIKQDSFGDVLKKSSAKDTFSSSAVSNTSVKVGSLGVAYTQEKLDNISAEIEKTDYSGMSKAEIYADIEKRYENAFDDFYTTRAVSSCQEHNLINNQFGTDIRNHIGVLTTDIVHEARGYSGMSYEEIETSIKEKYAGKTGFVDQLNLFGELYTSGVLSNKYGRENACNLASQLHASLDFRGFENEPLTKDEWLRRVDETGASSPFSLLLNAPYLSLAEKELFKSMVDDILFGVADKAEK